MKKIIAFGMILSMVCNSGTLRVEAVEKQIVPMETFGFQVESENMENATELKNKEENNDILLSCEQIKTAVGERTCFYILCNSQNLYDELVITEENSNLIQVKEISSDQLLYEKNGEELLKNAPSGVKWYAIEAKTEGRTSVSVESKGNLEKIQIVIDESVLVEKAEENLKDNKERFNEQKISSGWTQDGWYYYINGEPVKGIVEIQGHYYYFDEHTGRLCKKAQWIEKNGKRYYSNAEGVLYQNQMISFGNIYYYMGNDGSVQSGVIKTSSGNFYYAGTDGIIQKKAQWIECDGKKYYSSREGILYKNQVITFGDIGYCMGEDASVQYGISKADHKYYYTDENTGILIKKAGWIEANGKRYFSKADGSLYQNQFISFVDTYYYCGDDAAIVKNRTQVVSGVVYRFDGNGIMIKEGGWGEYNGNKYYKNPATGFPYKNQWVTFGRTWYYANSQGFMVSGWQTIGGYKYYFYSDTKYMARNVIIEGISIGDDGRVVAFGTCMSKFTTVSTNNSNGTYNMSKALKSFNQVVIQPGQTISFFGIAGPCGKAEGYLPAGVVGGIGYGGGICQASTTLYGAAIRAGLTIIQRRNHSVPSTYVPIGQDAMVNYGSSDLKFRNDFNFPVKLVTYTEGKTLYAEVWGTQPSWYDYIIIDSWWTGSRSAAANRKYIKNGSVVRTEQLPSSYYK